MKWVCTKINELSHITGIGNMKLFITVSMVVCGLAGCAAALLLHMIPVLGDVSLAKLMFICGGYGMFLVLSIFLPHDFHYQMLILQLTRELTLHMQANKIFDIFYNLFLK